MFEALVSMRDMFNDHVVFGVGILLITGYFIGRLAERVRLPAITGYIVAGLLLGESITGIIHVEMSESLGTITDVALGIIAITIGSEFSLSKLRRMGAGIAVITMVQMLIAFMAVAVGLRLWGLAWPYAFLLGAIASATAPAATVVIIQQLRARGEFVDTLYGIVALDDAGCVMLFAIVFAFVGSTLGAGGHALHTIVHALNEVVFSLLLGAAEGALLHVLTHHTKRNAEILIIVLGCIFIFTAVTITLGLSPLLANMMAGAVLINISRKGRQILDLLLPITPPLYAAFFAIAGTELDLRLLSGGTILLPGMVYVFSRAVGKYSGIWLGCKLAGMDARVRNWMGLSMLPQAGVAIGLVLFLQASPLIAHAEADIQRIFALMANIVLFAVLINELIGPPLSRAAIIRGADL